MPQKKEKINKMKVGSDSQLEGDNSFMKNGYSAPPIIRLTVI
jgi:hypothetical protein